MNKFIKGTIAGTAGIALLMGGAGSFALWTADTTVNAGTISSGTLSFTNDAADDGVWTVNGSVVDIDDYLIVPGDVLTYTDGFTINATGNNLKAHLTLDMHDMNLDMSSPLFKALDITGVSATGIPNPNLEWKGSYVNVKPSDDPLPVSLTVTLTFDKGALGDNSTQGGHVDLNGIGFTLTQVI